MSLPQSIDDTVALLESADYLADRSLATGIYLSLTMGRPLFLEGEAAWPRPVAMLIAKPLHATSMARTFCCAARSCRPWNPIRRARLFS